MNTELNPKIWQDNKLKPSVRRKIYDIVNAFLDYIDYPIRVADIHILGSNASYNYTNNSDLDVHLIVNFDDLEIPETFLQTFFNLEKSSFNKEYDIKIKGMDVEIYVEDINANTISNGIYSLNRDKWIKFPQHIEAPDVDLEPELSMIKKNIRNLININDIDKLNNYLDSIYLMRKDSLAINGEFGKGNLIFKQLRNEGLLNSLRDRIKDLTSKKLSLESKKLR